MKNKRLKIKNLNQPTNEQTIQLANQPTNLLISAYAHLDRLADKVMCESKKGGVVK